MKNLLAVTALLFSILLFAEEIPSISVNTLNNQHKRDNFTETLLDVRTPMEIKESGFIPKTKYFKNAYDKDVGKYISSLPKDKTYIVYCYAGSRSLKVAKLMKKNGYKVINLTGGISKWQNEGFKVQRQKKTLK